MDDPDSDDDSTPSSVSTVECLNSSQCHASEVLSTCVILLIACAVKYLHEFWAKRHGIPYSAVTMLVGACMGFSEFYAHNPYQKGVALVFTSALKLRGDYIILLFLPLLLFSPAYRAPLHSLRLLWKQILLSSFFGRTLDIVCVALSSTLLIGSKGHVDSWDVLLGLLFASIVTTTDSIDIQDALDGSGCDPSVRVLMEANALIGNGVSFLWHDVILGILVEYAANSLTASDVFANLAIAGFGAPAFGLLCGVLLSTIMKHVYNYWLSEVLIVVCFPFLTAWGGYHLCGVSGMISVIVLGIWMNFQKDSISAKVQGTVDRLMDTFTYVLDIFVFLTAGFYLAEVISLVSSSNRFHGYEYDWQNELAIYFTIFAFNIWSQLATLNILRPVVSRMKYGQELYDLRNILLMTWMTPKGASTIILLKHVLALNGDTLRETRIEAYPAFMLNVIIAIALSQILQGLTMGRLVKIIAMNAEHAESPVAILTRKGFLDMMSDLRKGQIVTMKEDNLFTDVNWDMVAKFTEFDVKEMGFSEQHLKAEHHMQKTRQHQISWQVLTAQVKCPDCDRASNIPREIMGLNQMAISRIIKAKKMSFRRQFESGMLTASALKILDNLADDALAHRKGVVSALDIRKYLFSDLSVSFKTKMAKFYFDYEDSRDSHLIPPQTAWRRKLFHLIQTSQFDDTIQGIIIFNVILTIYSLIVTSNTDDTNASDDAATQALSFVMVFLNAGFGLVYTVEAGMKMIGLGIKQYVGKAYITWNRFDFLILLMTYADILLDAITLSGVNTTSLGGLNPSAMRILRLARVLRASRALRLIRPLTPYILNLVDVFVTGHLYEAYNVARGFVVAQQEVSLVMSQLISFQPMAIGYRLEAESDAREIAHEIGVLNQQRPDIATAVKTRQAIRAIFNTIEATIMQLKYQGILEENEFARIDNGLDVAMKQLGNLPHRMPMRNPEKRLRNMPWVSGDEHIFEVLRHSYEERSFEIGTTFLNAGDIADGVYIIVNGLALLKTPTATRDHEKLGEIYNTDNIKTVFEESITPKKGKVENVEYALPGNALNEQALLIGFSRRSYVVAERKVDTIFIPAHRLFQAFKNAPDLEKLLWKHIVVSVVINIELRMHHFSESNYSDEKMRLSGGVIRLASPGRILAELDTFADVFLIVGSVIDLVNGFVYHAPSKLPNATRAVKIKSGRAVAKDEAGRILYPDYAVFFLVPQNGITIEEPTIHDSQMDLTEIHNAGTFNTVNQFRASVVQRKLRDELPDRSNINLLAAGNQGLNRADQPQISHVAMSSDETELQAALSRAQATRHVRTGSIAGGGALQLAMAGEQHVRVRATGYRRSSTLPHPYHYLQASTENEPFHLLTAGTAQRYGGSNVTLPLAQHDTGEISVHSEESQ